MPALDDDLIDELNATMIQLGRLFMSRHGDGGHGHEGHDVSGPKFLALRALDSTEPVKVSDIAELLGIKAPAASAVVDHLVSAGLAERSNDPDDRRVTRVLPTSAGRAMLEHAETSRRELMRRYCSVLSDEDVHAMLRINRTLIEAMNSDRI